MSKTRPIPVERAVRKALRETGLPFDIILGKKHRIVILNGKQVAVFSNGSHDNTCGAGVIRTIKKAVKGMTPA